MHELTLPLPPHMAPEAAAALSDYDRRQALQKWQAWSFLVKHNYERLYGVHPALALGSEDKYLNLLKSYFKDRVGHMDTARAIYYTEVLPLQSPPIDASPSLRLV